MFFDDESVKSQVPRTLLRINPGDTRVLHERLKSIDSMKERSFRSAEAVKRKFLRDLTKQRTLRADYYETRVQPLSTDVRRKIEKLKREEAKKWDLRRAEKSAADKIRYINKTQEREEIDEEDSLETAVRRVAVSPSVDGGAVSYESPEGLSRRSSLKSGSALELEPYRSESPGPSHTEEVLHLEGEETKSSFLKTNSTSMPEVVVTKPTLKTTLTGSSTPNSDEEKNSKNELLTALLPPPTSARFIGKLHATLQKSAESFSRKTSIASETIQEDRGEETFEFEESVPPSPVLKQVFDMTVGVPTSARFVGRLSKKLISGSSIDNSFRGGTGRGGSTRRGVWKKASQSSIDFQTQSRKKSLGSTTNKLRRKTNANRSPHASGTSTPSGNFSNPEELLTKLMISLGIQVQEPVNKIVPLIAVMGEDRVDDDKKLAQYWKTIHSLNKSSNFGEQGTLKNLESAINTESNTKSVGGTKSISDLLVKGMPTSSRFVGKLQSRRFGRSSTLKSQDTEDFSSDDENISMNKFPGLPTSFRYIGKSIATVSRISRGPNNIIIESPPPGEKVDFSHTVNMLTVLSKADFKEKQRNLKDHESTSLDEHTEPSKLGASRLRAGSRTSGSKLACDGSSKTGTSNEESNLRDKASTDEIKKLEKEDGVRRLFENLTRVRSTSIPNWNLHRHIQENKQRSPYYMKICQDKPCGEPDELASQEYSIHFDG